MRDALSAGLVEAVDDPNLLGAAFRPFARQREALAGIEAHRFSALACGRRSGKSLLTAAAAVWDAALRPHLDANTRPGEPRFSVCIAVNLKQSRLWLRTALDLLQASPLLRDLIAVATDDEIVLANGNRILAQPNTGRGTRGWACSLVVLDEFAWHVDGDGNESGEATWRASTPSTLTFGHDGRIIAASTPAGRNYFADLFDRAEQDADSFAMRASSPEMNERLDADLLRAEFEADPDMYASEIEARFTAGGGVYIDASRLRECVVDRGPLGRLDAVGFVIGADLAFQSDPACAVVVGQSVAEDDSRLLVSHLRRWEPARARDFATRRHVEDAMLGEIADLAKTYNATVVVDQFVSSAVEEFFSARGIATVVRPLTATSKSAMFAELRSRIYSREIELPADDDLLADLRSLRTVIRPGAASVATPRTRRGHADAAVALALAVEEMRGSGNTRLQASSGIVFDREANTTSSLADLLGGGSSGLSADMRLQMAGGGVPPGPVLMIVLAIERAPRIVTLARVEDESRLLDWLEGCGDERVRKLIADALAIVAEPRP